MGYFFIYIYEKNFKRNDKRFYILLEMLDLHF